MNITEALPEYQQQLIKKYLQCNIFKGCVSDVDTAQKALKSARNIKQLVNSGQYICIYGGLFGWGSKIKAVSYFTENTFYYKDAQINQAIIVPYTKIQKVIYNIGDPSGELFFENCKRLTLPKKVIVALKGVEIIRNMNSNSRNLLGEYIITQEDKFMGEYSTLGYFPDIFNNYFRRTDILHWITLRCKVVEVSIDRIEIKITVTDRDFDYFSPQEWEDAINTFSTRNDILENIKDELSIRLCCEYSLDQIVFSSRFRKSLTKAVSNGLNTVSNVASTAESVARTIGDNAYKDKARKAAHVARQHGDMETYEYYRGMYMPSSNDESIDENIIYTDAD